MLALILGISIISTSFFEVCSFGTPEQVAKYIDAGSRLEMRDDKGRTPLMCAAEYNQNPEVITLLVKRGANLEARGRRGAHGKYDRMTPLMIAASHNKEASVTAELLKCGAVIEARDRDGFTSHLLAELYNPNPKVAELLKKAGAGF